MANSFGISLPEILPDEDITTFSSSKTYNLDKISKLLPEDYSWNKPNGIEPISRGTPSLGLHPLDADGIEHDKYWRITKETIRGKWQGNVKVYVRGETEIGEFGEMMNSDD